MRFSYSRKRGAWRKIYLLKNGRRPLHRLGLRVVLSCRGRRNLHAGPGRGERPHHARGVCSDRHGHSVWESEHPGQGTIRANPESALSTLDYEAGGPDSIAEKRCYLSG